MTIDKFMERLRDKAPPNLSQASLEFAVMHCRRAGTMAEKDITTCLKLAAAFEEYWTFRQDFEASGVNAGPDADEDLPRTPLLTRDDYLDKLQPWATSIRQNIFQQDHAPCASKEAAAAWIQDKASNPQRTSREEQARLSQIDDGMRALHLEWRALTGVEWRDDGGHDSLWYQDGEKGGLKTVSLAGPDPWDEHPAMPSRELIELQHAVDTMYDVTGFYKDSLVTYILTDMPPEWPPLRSTASMIFHEFTDISRFQVSLDFLTGDVPFEDQRRVYRQYRKSFSTRGKKRLGSKAEVVIALVKRHGPHPQGTGSGTYWENIRQEFHKMCGRKVWKDRWAARKYYYRLITPARRKGIKR